jgi:two-component system, NarL family, nitrate/nitrite response regulator NarL
MNESPEFISVWLIDDDKAIRGSFKEAIHQNASYIKVSTFASSEDAFQILQEGQNPPDIILLDIHMPELSGIESIPHFKKLSPGSAIIMLTASFMDDEIMQAFSQGAEGYLLKTIQIGQIIDSIRAAMRGGVPMDPLVARRILDMDASKKQPKKGYGLTELEKDIIRLLVEGSTLHQISQVLALDPSAVNLHLSAIQKKLDVNTRSGLVMKAQREKIF